MFAIRNDLVSTLNEQDISVLSESEAIINDSIRVAIEEVKSLIQHRYDSSLVFPDIDEYDNTKAYAIGDIIYHASSEWSAATTYSIGNRVNYTGKIYKSLQNTNLNHNPATATTYWEYLYDEYEKFTCIKISTGHWPDDTEYWENADGRSTIILKAVCIAAIYLLFRKVSPRNIPNWIETERERQEKIVKEIGNGKRTVELPVKLDEDSLEEGHNITYGSSDTAKTWSI